MEYKPHYCQRCGADLNHVGVIRSENYLISLSDFDGSDLPFERGTYFEGSTFHCNDCGFDIGEYLNKHYPLDDGCSY